MDNRLSIFKNRIIILFLFILVIISFFSFGLILGKRYQLRIQNSEISTINKELRKERDACDNQIQQLTREAYALKHGLGFQLSTKKEQYNKDLAEVYSPLFIGKSIEVTTYKYIDATIVRKYISIDDYTGIDIWQYDTQVSSPTIEPPKDFAIFIGYENYSKLRYPRE